MLTYFAKGFVYSIVFWIVGVLIVAGTYQRFAMQNFPAIPQSKWQAVFLQNGQVYFGKLSETDSAYLALSDVYYLRSAADLQQNTSLNLVKLGGELHGPEDTIYVPKASVLFWENLKDTSRVVQSIQGFKQ